MENRLEAIKNFSSALNKGLLNKFGKIPSCSVVANQFNLRAYGTTTVTRETVRKWMQGVTLPGPGRLHVLIEWLNLNPSEILKSNQLDGNVIKHTYKGDGLVGHPVIEQNLYESIIQLSIHSRSSLLLTVQILKHIENGTYHTIDFPNVLKLNSPSLNTQKNKN
ncbi:MAG: hypothetical protein ACXWTR_02770 [Methylotenera sp.]